MIEPYTYEADLVRVIDGDTVVLTLHKMFSYDIDFGFYIKENLTSEKSTTMHFRLLGINTPEITGVNEEERAKGLAAKAELERLLKLGEITANTTKPDKYGRWLVTIFVKTIDAVINVNDELVKTGFAKVYNV